MRHAVLIMAHKNKEQLIRLIRSLACKDFDFFVHPDVSWDLSEQDLRDIETCAGNVRLASKRSHGELDQWSLPQITLDLIDDVIGYEKTSGISYSYFILLSGQDYPIKSKEYILDFLQKQYPRPLIDVDPYRKDNWVATKFMLVRWSHKIEEVHEKMKPGLLRKLRVAPYVIAEKLEKLFCGIPYQRIVRHGFTLWGGSQWWILPHGVIDYIVNLRKTDPKLFKEYSGTWTPEETFFQTMTMNSPMAQLVLSDTDIFEAGGQRCMTYANFITPKKSFRGHPHIITREDFERIMTKKQLFARKFDIEQDKEIFDMIDEVV